MEQSFEDVIDPARGLELLDQIERNPDVTQASLAAQLGVAVGTINWHLRRMVEKGYVKVKRAQRRKLRYIITPEGIAFRARLTVDYIEQSFMLFRRIRQRTQELVAEMRQAGYSEMRLEGDGDVAQVCRLTCLELGMPIGANPAAPALVVEGLSVHLEMGKDQ